MTGFDEIGFPQCIGAIDGCHIEIRPRHEEAVDYFNYKGWYSTVLLALVDARYRFLYINVGSPGRCNDSYIYERSLLKKEIQNCALLNEMSLQMETTNIPVLILADSAFRLSRNVMKPFPFHLNLTSAQKQFNYRLSKCRRVVENAFGHLKARFRRIGKGIDNNVQNANSIIKACCVLHNFLVEEKDEIQRIWLQEQTNIDRNRNYPNPSTNLPNNRNEAEGIRNALSLYFARTLEHEGNSEDENDGDADGVGDGDGNGDADDEGDGNSVVDGEDNGTDTYNGSWAEISCELTETL